jgi:large subunit ribosomal protein L30
MGLLSITWTKSQIGYRARHREVVRSLGLKRLNQTVVHPDNPSIRGMVHKVAYLVTVEEIEEAASREGESSHNPTTKSGGKEAKAKR